MPPGLAASSSPSALSSNIATFSHLSYQGLVSMPVGGTGGRHVEMMKFTADSIMLAGNVVGSARQNGVTTFSRSNTFYLKGNVVLYTTELSGCLEVLSIRTPVCVDLTPGSVQTVLGQIAGYVSDVTPITMSDAITRQPLTSASSLFIGSLNISFG